MSTAVQCFKFGTKGFGLSDFRGEKRLRGTRGTCKGTRRGMFVNEGGQGRIKEVKVI